MLIGGHRTIGVFVVRAVIAAVCFLLGGLPILAGTGLMRLEQPVQPLAIPIVILFGLVFIAGGVFTLYHPLRDLSVANGAHTLRDARRLAVRRTLARVNRASLISALTLVPLAFAFIATALGATLPWVSTETLIAVFTIEFITIHAFPFLVVASGFLIATAQGGAALRAAAVAGFLLLAGSYGFIAWVTGGGFEGLVWLVYLLAPNVAATVSRASSSAVRILAVSRWMLKFGVFAFFASIISDGDIGSPSSIPLGAAYFGAVVIVELYRLTEIPLDLATAWASTRPPLPLE